MERGREEKSTESVVERGEKGEQSKRTAKRERGETGTDDRLEEGGRLGRVRSRRGEL